MKDKFSIIYADPPWSFVTYSEKGKDRSPEKHYKCMSLEDICNLPVREIAATDSVLFLWVNGPRLFESLEVIKRWGFTYKSIAFTWVKQTKDLKGFPMGCGYWTRQNPEICLLGTRGHPHRVNCSIRNLVISPRQEHSKKPDEVKERIVKLMGDISRIELFARQYTPGWSVWGDEIQSTIELVDYNP